MLSDGDRVRIRAATRKDIPALVGVASSSVTDEEDRGFGRPRSESVWADAGRLAAVWEDPDRAAGEVIRVAELDGQVVGYVTLEDRGEALELINIDVARGVQGRGIGRALVRFAEEMAIGGSKRALTLGTSRNASGVPWKSLPWWQHLGYHITHEEENAWTRSIGPGVREIRMRKDLPPPPDLQLRAVEPGDLVVFFEQQRDPGAYRMAAFTPPDPDDRAAFEARWRRILGDERIVMRTITSQGRVVGSIGSYVEEDPGKREVTFWLGREFWGRGLATRALAAFLQLDTTRPMHGRAAADNAASLRVMEKCGFTRVGQARGYANARGEEIDEVALVLRAP